LVLGFRESSRRDEEIGFLRDEAKRREEEVALVREQVASDREDREREQLARLTVTPKQQASSSEAMILTFTVTNAGPRFATNILLRLRGEREEGPRLAGETCHDEPVLAGTSIEIAVETPPPERYFGPYTVQASWEDGRGRMLADVATVARR
jgi:hypothetical protein